MAFNPKLVSSAAATRDLTSLKVSNIYNRAAIVRVLYGFIPVKMAVDIGGPAVTLLDGVTMVSKGEEGGEEPRGVEEN